MIKWIEVPVSEDRQEIVGIDQSGDFYVPLSICRSNMADPSKHLDVVHTPRGKFAKASDVQQTYPYAAGIIRRLVTSATKEMAGPAAVAVAA